MRRSIPPPSQTLVRTRDASQREGGETGRFLFLVAEADRPIAGGARWGMGGATEIVVGRGSERGAVREGRTLLVQVPDARMSKRHARLGFDGDTPFVEDLGSTNGTFVGGRRITEKTPLHGELAELGGTFFSLAVVTAPKDTRDEDRSSGGTLVPAYAQALVALERVAKAGLPVLLRGESGTGKELLARAVHRWSARGGAFVAVNCGALPDALVEGQLFGHVKGAFSGAMRDEPGLVRASDGGTLFLDEIGDLPRSSQAALLRVLQESEVTSVGATRPTKVDLRVVSATHKAVEGGVDFRADLYARLAGFTHVLRPLRDRRADLGLLVAELLRELAPERQTRLRFTPEALRALVAYDFPLNVRELRHVLAAALVFDDDTLGLAQLPDAVRHGPTKRAAPRTVAKELSAADAALKEQLVSALEKHQGNVSEVARAFSKTRMQIHRWMKRFGLDPDAHR